ncbi:DSG1 protein, partial [Oxylabes madagascariensis]|nr:DSG1 protein [Oxylabes madagascariensis]
KVKEWDENGMARWKTFRRQKREWIKFAAACREGEDNSKRNPIARVSFLEHCRESSQAAPTSVFALGHDIFLLSLSLSLSIRCFAKHSMTGVDLEPPLELRVRVLDINDNPPVFAQTVFTGSVEESSMDNTLVMKIIATDADEPNHLNSKIAFKIESQEPSGPPMFIMNKYTGELHLANYLDREQHSSYTLVVKASDRDGAADGISSLCSLFFFTKHRYSIGRDPAAWFRINQNTGEITLNKVINRDSVYIVNGQYQAEVLAITRGKKRDQVFGNKLFLIIIIGGGGTGGGTTGGGTGGTVGGGREDGGGQIDDYGQTRPGGGDYEDNTGGQGYTDGYDGGEEGYTASTDEVIPILMSMSDCCGCGPGAAGGVGTGFEPVPECTEGAIHPWGIEGAQPEDRVSTSHVSKTRNIYNNTYGGGGVVASGVEETTGVGYGTGTGYGTAGGISGTGEVKGSIGGTIKEYREGGVNMAFLDNYFSEKAFVYADEDEGRPANDCLLIYDHEGVGTPVGSVGCCSFIGEDTDETYLDTLGPKFKTLAEICLGKEIEPFPDVNPPWPGVNISFPSPESDLNLPPPGTTIIVNGSAPMTPPVGTTTVVTENTYTSGTTIQPPRPMPDPLLHGNVTVTETYTSGSPSLCVDPLRASNVVVTERVVGPASASDLRGMLDIPDLTEGSNVIVTERVIAPNSRLPASLSIPDLVDGSNVVVTERVFRPASGMPGSLINIPSELSNAHNVVVTERVVSGSGMSSLGGTSLGGANLGGMSSTGQMLSADCHLGQGMGTASPGTSRRRVTKYSTVQYSSQ